MSKKITRQKPDAIIGVISDTHGLLRQDVFKAFENVDSILHAGDIGSMEIIDELSTIAPVHAVCGNMDGNLWHQKFPVFDAVEIQNKFFYVLHDLYTLDLNPKASNFHAVIFGHTHIADKYIKDNVLYLNPGSAGPIRNNRPPSVARICVYQNALNVDFRELS
jgi:hypothetical protein